MNRFRSALALLALLPVLSSCEKTRRKQAQDEAVKELQDARKDFNDDLQMTDEGLKVDFDSIDEHRKKIDAAADKMGGKTGEALKIVTECQARMNVLGRELGEKSEIFKDMVNWQSLAEKKDYEDRRKFMREYIALNEKFQNDFRGFHQDVMTRLDEIHFKGTERKSFDHEFLKERKKLVDLVNVIRRCDIECSQSSIGIIDRMEKLENGWSWNQETQEIEFTADEDAKWFNNEMENFHKQADRQLEAQKEYLELIKGN